MCWGITGGSHCIIEVLCCLLERRTMVKSQWSWLLVTSEQHRSASFLFLWFIPAHFVLSLLLAMNGLLCSACKPRFMLLRFKAFQRLCELICCPTGRLHGICSPGRARIMPNPQTQHNAFETDILCLNHSLGYIAQHQDSDVILVSERCPVLFTVLTIQ